MMPDKILVTYAGRTDSTAGVAEAMKFVQSHQEILKRKPFAVFQVCMTLAMRGGEKYHEFVAEWLNPVRSLVKPVSEGLFAGALDLRKIPSFGDRLKFRLSILFGVTCMGREFKDFAGKIRSQNGTELTVKLIEEELNSIRQINL
jgi:hypothetical protein